MTHHTFLERPAMSISPPIAAALAAVDEDYYTRRPDGSVLAQTTSARTIARMLDALDVRPGHRVLEIGTGSGFSGALLRELVGETGQVVSVDVVADLVDRARDLHTKRGREDIDVLLGDGLLGAPTRGPFDRIVAWASAERIFRAWVEQSVAGAVLVVPVELTARVRTTAIVRLHTTPGGDPVADKVFAGGYVEMHSEELTQWLVPPRGVDALVHDTQGQPWWLSADWAGRDRVAAEHLLALLGTGAEARPLLAEDESGQDFVAFLYATRPEEFGVVGLGQTGWRLGVTSPSGAALVTRRQASDAVCAGEQTAFDRLCSWVEEWRTAGRPGYADLRPVLYRQADGWTVRAELV
jgi:protein-L-isoaspartate(D-aspartate) O-methyltransferase